MVASSDSRACTEVMVMCILNFRIVAYGKRPLMGERWLSVCSFFVLCNRRQRFLFSLQTMTAKAPRGAHRN